MYRGGFHCTGLLSAIAYNLYTLALNLRSTIYCCLCLLTMYVVLLPIILYTLALNLRSTIYCLLCLLCLQVYVLLYCLCSCWTGWALYVYIDYPPHTGLRGAIAYALALNLVDQGSNFASKEVIQVLSTTTLVIVLFTILVFGGSTLPILKCLSKGSQGSDLTLSKTEDVGVAPAPSENQDEILAPEPYSRERHQWFMRLDYR